jgi:hypothetical protein
LKELVSNDKKYREDVKKGIKNSEKSYGETK